MLSPIDSSYLITGGTDCRVRYWDMMKPLDSYIVSGLQRQQKPIYSSDNQEGVSVSQENIILLNSRGGVRSTAHTGIGAASTAHRDCITDLAAIHSVSPMLVSAARDGSVKVWL